MSTVRTIRKLTKVAAELEQLAKAMQGLAPAAQAAGEGFAKLAQVADGAKLIAPVKGFIERA